MRWAVLSDVHANLHALRAVLAECRRLGVDDLLCAGDLVGYGPFPDACVELLGERDCRSVAGNHDLIAVGALEDTSCSDSARTSLRWTRDELRDDTRAALAQLPRLRRQGPLVVTHGSPESPTEYVTDARRAAELLAQTASRTPSARLLVLGHTHQPWLLDTGAGVRLLNPGSVGQSRSRSPDATFALVDLDDECRVELRRVAYDVAGCREALQRRGLPQHACHSPPASAVRRLAHRLPPPVRWQLRRVVSGSGTPRSSEDHA